MVPREKDRLNGLMDFYRSRKMNNIEIGKFKPEMKPEIFN